MKLGIPPWVAALGLLLTLATPHPVQADEPARVVRNARVYSGPHSRTPRVGRIDAPAVVTLLDPLGQASYVRVRLDGGLEGFVYSRFVVPAPELRLEATPPDSPAAMEAVRTDWPLTPDLDPLTGSQMRVHFIDVGQGDATLFEFPCGVMLVDAGGEMRSETETHPGFSSADRLEEYLDGFFDQRTDLDPVIDLFAISHPHIDHTRGIRVLEDRFPIAHMIDNGTSTFGSGLAQQRRLRKSVQLDPAAEYAGLQGPVMVPADADLAVVDPIGACGAGGGDPQIRVLKAPDVEPSQRHDVNDQSLVIRVDFGESSVLLTGDLEEHGIEELLADYATRPDLLAADVHQAGHHGSSNGSTDELAEAIAPGVLVFSMGPRMRPGKFTADAFGHPREEAFDMFQAQVSCDRDPVTRELGKKKRRNRPRGWRSERFGEAIFGTGWEGSIVLTLDADGGIDGWTAADPDPGLICP